jgi:hypothetical protein
MNIKTTLFAINMLLGTLYLGFPLLVSILAFNIIFWIGMGYNFFTSTEDEVLDKLLVKTKAPALSSEQIAFERFLIKNYVESHFTETELINQEIPSLEQRVVAPIEA